MARNQSKKFVGVTRSLFSSDLASAFMPESDKCRSVADVARLLSVDPNRVHQTVAHHQPQYQIYYLTPKLTLEAVAKYENLGLRVYLPSWLFSSPKWLPGAASSRITDTIKEIIQLAKILPRHAIGETFSKGLGQLAVAPVRFKEDTYSVLLGAFRYQSLPQQYFPPLPSAASGSAGLVGSVVSQPRQWMPLPSLSVPALDSFSPLLAEVREQNKRLLTEVAQLKLEVASLRDSVSRFDPRIEAHSGVESSVINLVESPVINLVESPVITLGGVLREPAGLLKKSAAPTSSVITRSRRASLSAASVPTASAAPSALPTSPTTAPSKRRRRRLNSAVRRALENATEEGMSEQDLLARFETPTQCFNSLCQKPLVRTNPKVEICLDCESWMAPELMAACCNRPCFEAFREQFRSQSRDCVCMEEFERREKELERACTAAPAAGLALELS
jgi:hypothetical protein